MKTTVVYMKTTVVYMKTTVVYMKITVVYIYDPILLNVSYKGTFLRHNSQTHCFLKVTLSRCYAQHTVGQVK